MDSSPPVPFRISTDGAGGTVEVGGQDVSAHLVGVRLELANRQPALLTLFTQPGAGTVEGVALVQQDTGATFEEPPLRASELLRALDPGMVEAELLARPTRITENATVVWLEVVSGLLEQLEAQP